MDDQYSAFRSMENPSTPLDPYLEDSGDDSKQIVVTDGSAKTFPPWWQAINVISSGVAQLPLLTYRRLDPKGKDRARDHATYRVLKRQPNRELGPFQFKQIMTMQCLSRGNAYAYIERKGGDVEALWPFKTGTITPVRANDVLKYVYRPMDGRQETIDSANIFHLRGPSDDGLEGISVVGLARESLSGGMQAQRFANRFFKNDAKPGIVLEFPDAVPPEAAMNILKNWSNRHGGAHNASKPAFLDRGGKVSPFSMNNKDAQFLESRQFSRGEVASWFDLPPHKVGDLTHATFSNIEQQSIDFVVYSLMPWLIRWQDECNAKLFRTSETANDSMFVEFLVSALLRGDYNSRMDGHTKALRMGLVSIDELRDMENMNPLPDGIGETHYITLDMAPVGAVPDEPVEPMDDGNDASRKIFALHLLNELSRAYQRIGKSATRAASEPERLQNWLRTSLPKECDKLGVQLEKACSGAINAGLPVEDHEYYIACVKGDFKRLATAEIDGEPDTLKARMDGLTKRMSSERPSELASKIWSD